MKRLLAISLMACSAFVLAEEDVTMITLHEQDIVAYKALETVNEICGTSIEAEQLQGPNNIISLNFHNIPCNTVLDLMVKFEGKES